MSWRLGVGLTAVVVASVAAVVIAIMSTGSSGEAAHIGGALKQRTGCSDVVISHPSRDPAMGRWTSAPVRSADITCGVRGPRVAYVQFADHPSLLAALATFNPSARYCLMGSSIVLDRLAAFDLTIFLDVCRSLGGTLVNGAG